MNIMIFPSRWFFFRAMKRMLKNKSMDLKKTMMSLLLVAQASVGFTMKADSTGLPGDHFSLEAALAMFKESSSIEDFEKRINHSNNGVNNLDLNQDGRVDFLSVRTDGSGSDRALVITAVLGKGDRQDVAVIEIARQGKESALLQIVGDEDLYGETKVVEPFEETDMEDDKGPLTTVDSKADIWINVWYWPCVSWFYGPGYIVYVSPWYWDFYPGWWSPWPPYTFVVFYGYFAPYHYHYHHVHTHRTHHIHQAVYMPRREQSAMVKERYRKPVEEYRKANPAKPVIQREPPPRVKPEPAPKSKPDRPQNRQDIQEKPSKPRQAPPRQRPAPRKPVNPR